MIIKSIAIIVFLLIISSLGFALYNLVKYKDQVHSEKTLKALTTRITLSVILFIFFFIALASGILKPHGIGSRLHQSSSAQPVNNR